MINDSRVAGRRKNPYEMFAEDYKVLDDVPYELDEKVLKDMQRMEHALSFILSDLEDPGLTLEKASEYAEMSPSYFQRAFRSYFDMPFGRFLAKLRLRQAARDIKDGKIIGGGVRKVRFFNGFGVFAGVHERVRHFVARLQEGRL